MAKSAVDRGKSYNTTPKNTACRKARVCLENCVTIIHCGCFMLHFQAYDDTSRTILREPLGGIFFLLKAAHEVQNMVVMLAISAVEHLNSSILFSQEVK